MTYEKLSSSSTIYMESVEGSSFSEQPSPDSEAQVSFGRTEFVLIHSVHSVMSSALRQPHNVGLP